MKKPIRIAIYFNNRQIMGIFTELPAHETPIEITLHDYDGDKLTEDEREGLSYSSGRWYIGETDNAVYAPGVVESVFPATEYED